MQDYYKILGVNSSATMDEIRRAYRILARRYHPDVNPGKQSEEKFKIISEAYTVISDPDKRRKYDSNYERLQLSKMAEKFRAYRDAQEQSRKADAARKASETARRPSAARPAPKTDKFDIEAVGFKALRDLGGKIRGIGSRYLSKLKRPEKKERRAADTASRPAPPQKMSVIEISVNIKDAIFGVKRIIEVAEPVGPRKVSVNIPPGVRNGSVIRLKESGQTGGEELVLIVRVASHPFLSIQPKGLLVEVPVSLSEAISGASITLPTLDEPAVVRVAPGSQSGTEIRLKGKGITQRDGSRGDLIYRLMVKIPDAFTAVGIKERVSELEKYYHEPVRRSFPNNLMDFT